MRIWGLSLAAAAMWCFSAQAKVKVIDGDSLVVDGTEVRLEGIDAPEYHQECYDEDDKPYSCGDEAYKALLQLAGSDTTCEQTTVDRYRRSVAICTSGGKILNEEMVLQGHAVAYTRYTDIYAKAEQKARKAQKGIWRGRFMKPELYRALMRE